MSVPNTIPSQVSQESIELVIPINRRFKLANTTLQQPPETLAGALQDLNVNGAPLKPKNSNAPCIKFLLQKSQGGQTLINPKETREGGPIVVITHPFNKLVKSETKQILKIIVLIQDKHPGNVGPLFEEYSESDGALLVTCKDESAAKILLYEMSAVKLSDGMCVRAEVLLPVYVLAFSVPDFLADEPLDFYLGLIGRRNDLRDVMWEEIHTNPEFGPRVVLIDEKTAQGVREKKFALTHDFGTAEIHFMGRIEFGNKEWSCRGVHTDGSYRIKYISN